MKDFAKYPTEKNYAYVVGYLVALHDNGLTSDEHHSYMLAMTGQLETQEYIRDAIKEIT